MAISAFNGGQLKLLSDGEKIVLLHENGLERQCFILTGSLLSNFRIKIDRQQLGCTMSGDDTYQYEPGLIDVSTDISLRGGSVDVVNRPLVMGVDIFDQLSITDYLDIINEKIKVR